MKLKKSLKESFDENWGKNLTEMAWKQFSITTSTPLASTTELPALTQSYPVTVIFGWQGHIK